MTLTAYLQQYDRETIASGINILHRLLHEGASWSDARAQANEFMRLRFKSRARIEEAARLLARQPPHASDWVN